MLPSILYSPNDLSGAIIRSECSNSVDRPLALKEMAEIASGRVRVGLAPAALAQMEASRSVVRRVAGEHVPVYGINTGFGKLCEVRIADDAIEQLQLNLVRSHACGLGRPLSPEETRVAMALRANTLALGYSGVRPVIAEMVLEMLDRGVLPVIPEKGSVGRAETWPPLAHLALTIIGKARWSTKAGGGRAARRCGWRESSRCDWKPRRAWRCSTERKR